MNYAQLQAAIAGYVENPDATFAAQIPLFIRQAETRIFNSVQFPSLRKNVTGTVTSGNAYLSCPDDFLAVYSLAVIDGTGQYSYLLNKDVNFIREAYTSPATTGLPKFYALFGPQSAAPTELSFILGPTPGSGYTMELHYFFYPESITTAASGQTWLGDNFDPVLLYGSLVEAYTYLKGETDLLQLYDGKYKEALTMAKRLGDGMERQDAYRSGQFRQPVN
ncbi:MAG: hypothetical protein ACK5JJ_14060 [Cyanobacteriota bacterium]|jgi:hypothetical protein